MSFSLLTNVSLELPADNILSLNVIPPFVLFALNVESALIVTSFAKEIFPVLAVISLPRETEPVPF